MNEKDISKEERKKILFARSQDLRRDGFSGIFKKFFPDYDLETFEDGKSLDERLRKKVNDIALVVLGEDISGVAGSEVIKKYSRKSNFPFVLFYDGGEEIGKQAIEDGAFGYLRKRFYTLDIKKLVEKALDYKK